MEPFANPDHVNCHPFFWIIRRYDRGFPQVASPAVRRLTRNKKHYGNASSCRGRLSTAASRACSTLLQAPTQAVPCYPVPMWSP
jgi:hypothetical protein